MMASKVEISKFYSFEERALCFQDKTGICLPRMTFGKGKFFSDLIGWMNDYGKKTYAITLAHVLPNPAHGLSFPNAADVLSSALSLSPTHSHSEADIHRLLNNFGLPEDKATQPIVSLSGGELLLLNFAKAMAMLPVVNGIVACSPCHWLSKERYKYWVSLADAYIQAGKSVDVLLLDGEPFPNNSINVNDDLVPELAGVKWNLQVNEPEILFDEIQFPTYHPKSVMKYSVQNERMIKLNSPTLFTGDNGVGKSVFSKILSGIIKTSKGKVNIIAPNGKGNNARLLFQDSIAQLFGKSIDDHHDWVFRFERDKRHGSQSIYQVALSIYSKIDAFMREYVKSYLDDLVPALGKQSEHNTLLQAKMSLIAERLASRPPLLILDEPGWGLSRSIARQFIWAVCQQANIYNVAILLISHQSDCWKGIIKSHLHLTKMDNGNIKIEEKDI